MNRRTFIQSSFASGMLMANPDLMANTPANPLKINVFSKMFQWIEDYNALAETLREIGFDGADLTVRPAGHVLPERVEEDLPKAVQALKKAKVEVPMMVTGILKADDATERILKTAKSLGINHYRMGWYPYDLKKDIPTQVESLRQQMKGLAVLNEKYQISGEYQNHAGNYLGASMWDLHGILKQINSPYLGVQYDINHATAEASTAWETGFHLIAPYIKSLAIKDFRWIQKDGKYIKEGCPLGEGMVNWKKYLPLVKQYNLSVPLTMHYEYALGGAENGNKTLSIDRSVLVAAMKKDLALFKGWMYEAGF